MLSPRERGEGRGMLLLGIFLACLFTLVFVLYNLPPLSLEDGRELELSLPKSRAEIQTVAAFLKEWLQQSDENTMKLVIGMSAIYVFLQTFCVPGSTGLNVLAGYLFSWPVAFSFAVVNATIGASLCYWLSHFTAKKLVARLFPLKLAILGGKVKQAQGHFFLFLFLRLSPMLPNWFLNLATPLVPVHFAVFAFGTMIGVMPASYLGMQFGSNMRDVLNDKEGREMSQLVTDNIFSLLLLCMIPLIPVAVQRIAGKHFEDKEKERAETDEEESDQDDDRASLSSLTSSLLTSVQSQNGFGNGAGVGGGGSGVVGEDYPAIVVGGGNTANNGGVDSSREGVTRVKLVPRNEWKTKPSASTTRLRS